MKAGILLAAILNLFFSVILYKSTFRRASDGSGIMRLLICLAIPLVGLLWALLLRPGAQGKIETSGHKTSQQLPSRLGGQQEDRIISMREAPAMNGSLVCCSMLLDVLKDDPIKFVGSIREALNSGDAETAHYAAAAVMQMRSMLMERVTRLAPQCQSQKPDPALLEDYADALETCLTSHLFDEAIEMSLSGSFEKILGRLLALKPTPESFVRMVELSLRNNDLAKAEKASREFLSRYPAEEKAYLLHIECLIRQNDNIGLRDFLVALPTFPVELTQMTLQYIRCLIDAGFAV